MIWPRSAWCRRRVDILAGLVARREAFLVTGDGFGQDHAAEHLLSAVDPGERLVVVEDSAELQPAHPHVVRLEARPANTEGSGAVTVRDLVRQALRMRPDRVVVGEVRGGEVVDLLSALNTGHEGGCGTVHANSAADVPARLESLALPAGMTVQACTPKSPPACGQWSTSCVTRRGGWPGIAVLRAGPDGLVSAVPAVVFRMGALPGPGGGRRGMTSELLVVLGFVPRAALLRIGAGATGTSVPLALPRRSSMARFPCPRSRC